MDYTPKPVNHSSVSEFATQLSSHIKGKTVLVTGASPASLALAFLKAIAPHGPKELILAGRSASKLDQAARDLAAAAPEVKTRNLVFDLESLESVRHAAGEVNAWSDIPVIDVLVLNAGIMGVEYGTTKDGIERQFGVNHVAQFLFTNLIIDKILAGPEKGRIVVVSSDGHAASTLRPTKDDIGFNNGKTYNRWVSYGQAKTSNVLFATALADKLGSKGLQAYSLHPGAIHSTGLGAHVEPEMWGDFRRIIDGVRARLPAARISASTNTHTEPGEFPRNFRFKTAEDGAATYVPAAFDPALAGQRQGLYLQNGKLDPSAVEEWATDPAEAERLWALSEEYVGQKFSY